MTRAMVLTAIALGLVGWVPASAGAQTAAPVGVTGAQAGTEMEIKGLAVNVRSGPGTYFYEVAKLNEPTRVRVVAQEPGWSGVRPPASVTALVKKTAIQRGDGSAGLALEDARLYARDPASDRTWAVIGQIRRDDQVTIKGEQGDYYEVATPAEATVWVKSEFLRTPTTPGAGTDTSTGAERHIELPEIKPIKIDPETKVYEDAVALLDEQLTKPNLMDRQFSDDMVAKFKQVAEKAETGYLQSAAEQALATVEMQKELQAGVEKMKTQQKEFEAKMKKMREEADAEASKRVGRQEGNAASIADFEGTLRKMVAQSTYGWRLEDADGRYVCLVTGDAAMLNPLLGQTVRLWGNKQLRADLGIQVCEVMRIEPVAKE